MHGTCSGERARDPRARDHRSRARRPDDVTGAVISAAIASDIATDIGAAIATAITTDITTDIATDIVAVAFAVMAGVMKLLNRYALFQQAYLVNDVSEACRQWDSLFGAGPFVVAPHHRTESFTYRGTAQEADVSYAFGYLGETMIQFIEQHDDTPSIYRDMYRRGEEGFHHVGVLVNDYAAEKQRLLDMGFELACELYADNVNACYIDTRSAIGCFTEIHADPPHILAAFSGWRRAHELRRDGDPVFIS